MVKNRSLPPELTGASRGMACGRVRLDEWRNVFKATIGLALLLGVASACSDKPEASSKALAIINGKEITASEFDLRWSQIPDYARKTFAGPEGVTGSFYKVQGRRFRVHQEGPDDAAN